MQLSAPNLGKPYYFFELGELVVASYRHDCRKRQWPVWDWQPVIGLEFQAAAARRDRVLAPAGMASNAR